MRPVDSVEKLDEARTLASNLQAQMEAARALLQARECTRTEGSPDTKALELTSREAYGLGLLLVLLADQMGKLGENLEQAQKALFRRAS